MEVVFLRKALFPRPRGLPSIFFLVGDGTSRGGFIAAWRKQFPRSGCHNDSQAYGTEIPNVRDWNPKRMRRESQAYETEIPSAWDTNPKRMGLIRDLVSEKYGFPLVPPLRAMVFTPPSVPPLSGGTDPLVCRWRATFVS